MSTQHSPSRYKYFRVNAYLPFCCPLFAAGFALRAYGAFHYGNAQVFIASTFLIYMSPYAFPQTQVTQNTRDFSQLSWRQSHS